MEFSNEKNKKTIIKMVDILNDKYIEKFKSKMASKSRSLAI
jgi:hypothetical protein